MPIHTATELLAPIIICPLYTGPEEIPSWHQYIVKDNIENSLTISNLLISYLQTFFQIKWVCSSTD